MRRKHKRRAEHILINKQSASGKPDKIARSRVYSRARRVRFRMLAQKARAFVIALLMQVKKGSVRAIVALGVSVLVIVGLPVGLLIASGGQKRPPESQTLLAEPEQEATGLLDISTKALSAGNSPDEAVNEIAPSPTPEPHPTNTVFKRGMEAPVVAEIQERLMELGYMDQDEPTQFYGPITKTSVEYFQRKHGLVEDGCVGLETYTLLMSPDAKVYTVGPGDSGEDVLELQKRLRELGYINKATQYYGTETESAVKKFQERNGLSPDGTVGEMTREALYSDSAKANFFERGEVREEIKPYQERLKELGYYAGEIDGTYGSGMEAAVRRFQERSGLIGDGYLGPETIRQLKSKNAQKNAIMIGMNGKDVENIQKRLKELGYLSSADGYFGEKTDKAVRNFQATNGLSVDGKVGAGTLKTLSSSKAKRYDGEKAGSSSSSGSSSGSGSGTTKAPAGASLDTFISVAKSKLGSRYVRGGKGPSTFDCSGFVYWCLNQAGVKQGYMTSASWQKTTKYQRISKMSDLKKGDVVSFKGHVGIYLGGGQMIDASSSEGKIRICSNIQNNAYWKRTYVCGYRIF